MTYTFIHPTKSGGTAIELYMNKYYSDYITGRGHGNVCTNYNNPIIVVRDVKSRFISMYKYWKNGAIDTRFKRDINWRKKYKNFTILDFINMLKFNKKKLYSGFTWNQHFNSTSSWINNTDYKNIIIIKYDDNLNKKIHQLIDKLNIPNKNIPLGIVNKSFVDNYDVQLIHKYENQINQFIKVYFKDDIDLIYKINNHPELFKIVM